MLARAFALVGKGTKRLLDMSIQAFTAPRCRSHMPRQLRYIYRRLAPPEDSLEERHQLQSNSRHACISEPNWVMQHHLATMENSADSSLDSIRDGGRFDQMFETLRSIGEECVDEYELRLLLKKKTAPICYVWCDPSPSMHIAQGIIQTISVNKMVKAGFKVKILMADWFARLDYEIGGNLNKVRTVGLYNIEIWKATGMDLDGVEFVWLSDEINRHEDEYWSLVMDIAGKTRLSTITGYLQVPKKTRSLVFRLPSRRFGSINPYWIREARANEIFYPCLQCAGVLFQKVDIWLLGVDQLEATMLAREYCNYVKMETKPIVVLQNTLPNLLQCPEMEAFGSKSWAIFMEDVEDVVRAKIRRAFCPPKLAEGNPCFEYIKYIILPWFGKFEVVRKEESGGNKTFLSMEELIVDYESGALHPDDVKQALVKAISKILQPVRDHFRSSAEAKDLQKAILEYYNNK